MNFKLVSAAGLLAVSYPLLAQTNETELEPVIITANRVARTASETLAAVTVITRRDVERSQAQSVPELLAGLPGVAFANNGGPGKVTSLYLRGTTDSHTLVLVDGVKIGSATLGSAALQDIPVDQIERIEIVRGPRASLYGSEAIGGVIQIFTRKGRATPSVSVTGGSRGTFETAAQASIGDDEAWLSAGLSTYRTRGINARQDDDPDRDGYRNESVNLRGGFRPSAQLSIEVQGMQTSGRNFYDGFTDESHPKVELFAGSIRYTPNDHLRSTLRLAHSRDTSTDYAGGTLSSRFDTLRTSATWQNDLTLAPGHTVSAGLDYLRDRVAGTVDYTTGSRTNRAVFGQYLAEIAAFDAQLAARHDDNEQFGHHNSGSAALGYTFSPALRMRASYGTAFKAPTFNALYYPFSGDPTLQPERSRSKEVGLSGTASNVHWDLSLFDSWLSNMVEWIEKPAGNWNPYNTTARIRGAEVSARARLGATTLAASYTQMLPQYEVDIVRGNLLARRARQTGRVEVDHDLSRWSIGATLAGAGKRYDDAANTVKLAGYATLDLRAEYRIDSAWRVQTRLANVFDKRYETASQYNQPGFGAFVTLRYQPR